ncbi:SDR family oxidoreductase [Aquamicrobium sp. NLF2-7]|uniref:SDR family oxidoreductase n=1 Tax=Aquamicrobium sp. NLF2-7 TaxID=2918753 RepID=UPI001EFC0FE4|nr:SDR family oxidoreductase [Aquamicrobium sp. NLF2-7]MCG8273508.1 SDR family oxidoreductase [Aquamicrobium sp. NLF2-7]MCG8273801.1 SDR family oxidoreductase [Aquamicrobium sp. NLF2-7]
MAGSFDGKVVFITGAANGQGKAAALAFAREGAWVAGFDLGSKPGYPAYVTEASEALARVQSEIAAEGGAFLPVTGDVRRQDDVRAAIERTVEVFGGLDIVFGNAGIAAYGLAHELSEDEWDAVLDINLKGNWLVAKHAIPHLKARGSGVILFNSSIAGLRGLNRLSHYSASKFGLVGLAKSLAIELAPDNIRVVTVHPTGVNTPMNDGLAAMEGATPEEIAERSAGNLLPVPWIEPEDVAEAVLFLASEKSRFVTGSGFVLDAGLLTR